MPHLPYRPPTLPIMPFDGAARFSSQVLLTYCVARSNGGSPARGPAKVASRARIRPDAPRAFAGPRA